MQRVDGGDMVNSLSSKFLCNMTRFEIFKCIWNEFDAEWNASI